MVRIGLVLSVVVVGAAVWFARRDDGSAPELDWIYEFVVAVIAGVALIFIWIGVLLATLADKRDEERRRREG
jgi:hypothetical protein